MTNILIAINNFANNPITKLGDFYKNSIRIQQVGDALEYYVKDMFCNSFEIDFITKKQEIYTQYFSFLGNANNPPDMMLKNGDAIEVKKIEGIPISIALNSSYPKDKIYANDPLITESCKNCEKWHTKDIIYIIGSIKTNTLNSLWLVYGNCFAADKTVYERVKLSIAKGINDIPDVVFSKTKELGRVNKVDPLGVTYLRVRGMWGIEHPIKIFDLPTDPKENILNTILLQEKFNSFPAFSQDLIINNKNINIHDIKIKNPNNPAKLINAKYIYIKGKDI